MFEDYIPWIKDYDQLLSELPDLATATPSPEVDRLYLIAWIVKIKWKEKLKLRQTKLVKAYRPEATMLKLMLDMAAECQVNHYKQYGTAIIWFSLVFDEITLGFDQLSTQEKISRVMTNQINIYSPKTEPHAHRLIESAMKHRFGHKFRDKVFLPYLAALHEWFDNLLADNSALIYRVVSTILSSD